MGMIDTSEVIEKVILVAVKRNDRDNTEASLDELEELAQTAGAQTLAKVIQNRESFHSATYIYGADRALQPLKII